MINIQEYINLFNAWGDSVLPIVIMMLFFGVLIVLLTIVVYIIENFESVGFRCIILNIKGFVGATVFILVSIVLCFILYSFIDGNTQIANNFNRTLMSHHITIVEPSSRDILNQAQRVQDNEMNEVVLETGGDSNTLIRVNAFYRIQDGVISFYTREVVNGNHVYTMLN